MNYLSSYLPSNRAPSKNPSDEVSCSNAKKKTAWDTVFNLINIATSNKRRYDKMEMYQAAFLAISRNNRDTNGIRSPIESDKAVYNTLIDDLKKNNQNTQLSKMVLFEWKSEDSKKIFESLISNTDVKFLCTRENSFLDKLNDVFNLNDWFSLHGATTSIRELLIKLEQEAKDCRNCNILFGDLHIKEVAVDQCKDLLLKVFNLMVDYQSTQLGRFFYPHLLEFIEFLSLPIVTEQNIIFIKGTIEKNLLPELQKSIDFVEDAIIKSIKVREETDTIVDKGLENFMPNIRHTQLKKNTLILTDSFLGYKEDGGKLKTFRDLLVQIKNNAEFIEMYLDKQKEAMKKSIIKDKE